MQLLRSNLLKARSNSAVHTVKANSHLSFKEDLINAAKFTAFLIAGVFALLIALQLADNIDIPVPTSFVPALSYVYIVSYTLLAGLLVYYGVDNYNNVLAHFTSSPKLRDLTSVSTIVAFALIFSMLIKKIIAKITGRKLTITAESMLIGFVAMRGLLIGSFAVFDPR
jgi:uncharacterized membrane protein YcgQ (UPF0703/DUF1980 family)